MEIDIAGSRALRQIYESGLASVDPKTSHLRSISRTIQRWGLEGGTEVLAKLERMELREIEIFHDGLVSTRQRQAFLDSVLNSSGEYPPRLQRLCLDALLVRGIQRQRPGAPFVH